MSMWIFLLTLAFRIALSNQNERNIVISSEFISPGYLFKQRQRRQLKWGIIKFLLTLGKKRLRIAENNFSTGQQ